MAHGQGLDLANVLQNVETIRGSRLQNQLSQQTLQANTLAQQGSNQFNALLQQHFANPTQQSFNAIAAVSPEAASQIQGLTSTQQTQTLQQQKIEQQNAQVAVAGATNLVKSADPATFAKIALPQLVEEMRKNPDIDVDSLTNADWKRIGNEIIARQTPIAQAGAGDTAALQTFAGLTEGLTDEQREQARQVELGIAPRAGRQQVFNIGDVPHVFDSNTGTFVPAQVGGEDVTAETVAESEATIARTVELAKGEAKLTSKTIDKGFETIGKIRTNVANINRAIAALDAGARTGAIDRFLPNITAASVELGQIQKELGLDIISAVTFGALSQGEMDLALSTALPVGLDEPALRDFLVRKRDAQNKLSNYFVDQINFLDAGGTLVEFLNQQRETFEQADNIIRFDAQGNQING